MKHLLLLTIALISTGILVAQSSKQVNWSYSTKKIDNSTYEVHMTASINGDWHMYAQDGGDGPVSTTFNFKKNPLLSLEGKVKEDGNMKKVFEEAFNSEVRYFEKSVTFVQVVKVRGKAKTNLSGSVEFMVCNDTACLPPAEVEFSVNIGG